MTHASLGHLVPQSMRPPRPKPIDNPPVCMDNLPVPMNDSQAGVVCHRQAPPAFKSFGMDRREKGEGFPGQRIVVLPRSVVERALRRPLTAGLVPTDVGYFPSARGHLRERPAGVNQAIFIYCAKGAGWCELAGRRHHIHPGELLVVPPNTPHAYGADPDRPWTIHWFHARGNLVGGFLAELELGLDRPVVQIGEEVQLLSLFGEVLEVVEHGYGSLQLLEASHALGHLLVVLVRAHRKASRKRPTGPQRIAQAIEFMKEHLDQPLQLQTVMSVANLSRSQFVDLFKRQTGYAPIDYFIRLRMHRACQMLDTTALSVKEVAAALGYEDPLYFSRSFRHVNELSPKAYRAKRKG